MLYDHTTCTIDRKLLKTLNSSMAARSYPTLNTPLRVLLPPTVEWVSLGRAAREQFLPLQHLGNRFWDEPSLCDQIQTSVKARRYLLLYIGRYMLAYSFIDIPFRINISHHNSHGSSKLIQPTPSIILQAQPTFRSSISQVDDPQCTRHLDPPAWLCRILVAIHGWQTTSGTTLTSPRLRHLGHGHVGSRRLSRSAQCRTH